MTLPQVKQQAVALLEKIRLLSWPMDDNLDLRVEELAQTVCVLIDAIEDTLAAHATPKTKPARKAKK